MRFAASAAFCRAPKDLADAFLAERLRQLAEKIFRDLAADANIRRRRSIGIEIGAKQQIEEHDILTVVRVALAHVLGMMPAMQSRRAEDIIENTGSHIDVAVGENAHERRDRTKPPENLERCAQQIDRQLAEGYLEQRIGNVEAACVDDP